MTPSISILTLSFGLILMPPRDVDMKQEPPREVIITVDGKPHRTEPNQVIVLKGKFEDPKIRIEVSETRRFSNAGISFEYPAYFEWEFEQIEGAYNCWTMSGDETSIMVFDMEMEMTAKEHAESMSDTDFMRTESMSPITRILGKSTLDGIRVVRNYADPELKDLGLETTQDIFDVPTPKGRSRLLLLNGVTPELKSDTDEFDFDSEEPKIVLKYLTKSFAVDQSGR
ncbi:MAG TPA: hypothetical protein PKN33_10125 [Phycisphaerae bacterium]|nr:hypothetical protein [Phycisphaerae bacterium]